MTPIYKCDVCGKEFKDKSYCLKHEKTHFKDMSAVDALKLEVKNKGGRVCDYCTHVYYVYGSEPECQFLNNGKCSCKNNWPKFELFDLAKKLMGD